MVSRLKNLSKSNTKTALSTDNITIDAKHSEMVNHFKNLQDSIPLLKDELKKLISEYNNKDSTRKNDIEYIIYKDSLIEKINDIKNRINTILNNEEINNYYLDVGVLLHSYYENIENSKNIEDDSENFEENLINYTDILNDDIEEDEYSDKKDSSYKSVLNFFSERDNSQEDLTKNDGVYTSMKISDFVKEESKFKKKNVLDEYLQKIDPNYITKIKIDMNICKCPTCLSEMTLYPSDGIQICENCGIQENILIESDKPSFKDPPMEVCYFSYKRINHYNEFTCTAFFVKRICVIKHIFKNIYNFLIN